MKKVCKDCKIFVKVNECPVCKGSKLKENWQGRINILDSNISDIAKKTGIKVKGEYVIKIR